MVQNPKGNTGMGLEGWPPEVQMVAKQLKANPDWVLYPTDDLFAEKEEIEGRAREHGILQGAADYWRHTDGFMEKPHTVKKATERYIQGRWGFAPARYESQIEEHPKIAALVHEGLWPETEIAANLLDGMYTLDPREAAMHISDKYTGPKD